MEKLKFYSLVDGRFYHLQTEEKSIAGELVDRKFGKVYILPFTRGKTKPEPVEIVFKEAEVREISREHAYELATDSPV